MTVKGHITVFSFPGWGHVRSLVVLACRIVQQRPDIGVTILIAGDAAKKAEEEVTRSIPVGDPANENIRVIGTLKGSDVMALRVGTAAASLKAYELLSAQQPITCVISGKIFQPWPKPKVVLTDIFLNVAHEVRSIDPAVTVLGWSPPNNSASFRISGPEHLGGLGDIGAKSIIEAEKTGRSIEEIETELCRPDTGKLVHTPGLPPMYDYEFLPQQACFR
ncbi:glycosyltransferase family 1 protein [Sphaerobolus stellatus SS14]|uniref:Glycosyltransferase family 1 protein n=1 Tax=Sphaerobolus stellatus (strain SS14) TaxID=990650 RepID=A0A0C9UJY6_SPHS4|nr:glycosyltransferase family 1 protein [Sphaerobolus stellatus SS14]